MPVNEISVDIKSSNAKSTVNILKKIDRKLGTNISNVFSTNIDETMSEYAQEFMQTMKSEVHVRSGALRDSIDFERKSLFRYEVGVNGGRLIADARNISKTDYSIPYHNGHKAYTIYPRKAKVLHWVDENGNDRFAKFVKIPASSGDKFVKRAVDNRPKL